MSFYEDADGNKYVVGADAAPKKLGSTVETIGQYSGNQTIDVSNRPDYKSLTEDDFIIEIISLPVTGETSEVSTDHATASASGCSPVKSYNNQTGLLIISGMNQYIQQRSSISHAVSRKIIQSIQYKVLKI